MIVCLESAACLGLETYIVKIEVDVAFGLPQFNVVGLPDQSIKESRERVRSAIKNSGYPFPADRITINLAPADVKKEGPSFDLAMAVGILTASEFLKINSLESYIFLGELALDGSLRPFKGALAISTGLKNKNLILPWENAAEAALSSGNVIYPVKHFKEVIGFLQKEITLEPYKPSTPPFSPCAKIGADFSEVKGQSGAKRAIEVAVAGGHNILLIGPPGSGKSMLSRRIPGILPPFDFEEALEITKIQSASGMINGELIRERPFRSPHHSISMAAMAGGGSWPKPGEVSLAHGGVLFLDELPEFRRDVLEALRGPLEDGKINISRAKSQVTYPSQFMLVAAMNPCPCGQLYNIARNCRCSLGQIQKYQSRVSGPILDRIDLHVEVPAIDYKTLSSSTPEESSETIRSRITRCRKIQQNRFKNSGFYLNTHMRPKELKNHAHIRPEAVKLLELAMKELRLSARAYFKILKISRTIGDLAESEYVLEEHLAEAIQYRNFDRQWR